MPSNYPSPGPSLKGRGIQRMAMAFLEWFHVMPASKSSTERAVRLAVTASAEISPDSNPRFGSHLERVIVRARNIATRQGPLQRP